MELIKSIYRDSKGNPWTVEKHELPKKKGSFKFWTGENETGTVNFRESQKKLVIKQIENYLIDKSIKPIFTDNV